MSNNTNNKKCEDKNVKESQFQERPDIDGKDNKAKISEPASMPPGNMANCQMVPETWRGWLVVLGGFLVHLSLGTLYTFGNMSPYFTSYIRARSSPSNLKYTDSSWIFALNLMGQGLSMFLGGIIAKKIGPRWTTLIGGLLQSSGMFLTYFTIQSSFYLTLLTYGLIFGFGVGIAYASPLAAGMQWLPDRKGLVNGIILAGFGGGAFIFNQVQTSFINPHNKSPDHVTSDGAFFTDEDVLNAVPSCFLLLGGCYVVLQVIGSLLIVYPPKNEYANDETPLFSNEETKSYRKQTETVLPKEDHESIEISVNNRLELLNNIHPKEVLKQRGFYILWFMFFFNGQAIVIIGTLYKAFGQSFIFDDHFLAITGSFASIGNALGRIMWGHLADRFGFRVIMMVLCGILAALLFTLFSCTYGGKAMFFIWICLIFLTFCGNFALFPTVVAKCFGPKYVAINFGLVFTSQVATSPLAAGFSQLLLQHIHWFGMFFYIGVCTVIGGILAFSFNTKGSDGNDV